MKIIQISIPNTGKMFLRSHLLHKLHAMQSMFVYTGFVDHMCLQMLKEQENLTIKISEFYKHIRLTPLKHQDYTNFHPQHRKNVSQITSDSQAACYAVYVCMYIHYCWSHVSADVGAPSNQSTKPWRFFALLLTMICQNWSRILSCWYNPKNT